MIFDLEYNLRFARLIFVVPLILLLRVELTTSTGITITAISDFPEIPSYHFLAFVDGLVIIVEKYLKCSA